MTFKPARLLLALIAVSAAPAFAQNLAVVNGKPIPTSRVEEAVKQMVAAGQGQDSPQLRAAIKDEMIAREVLMQEAIKQGYDKKPEVKTALDNARQAIVVNQLAKDFVAKNPVSDAEVKAEYDRFVKQSGDKEYHVRHILLENEADAKAVIAKLKGGAKFEELAKQSKDGSAQNGGDLDWASPGNFVPEFSKAMVALQKGAITETPVKSQYGYHVIKLEDVRAAKIPPLDEVKQQVAEQLQQRQVAQYRESLVKKATVK